MTPIQTEWSTTGEQISFQCDHRNSHNPSVRIVPWPWKPGPRRWASPAAHQRQSPALGWLPPGGHMNVRKWWVKRQPESKTLGFVLSIYLSAFFCRTMVSLWPKVKFPVQILDWSESQCWHFTFQIPYLIITHDLRVLSNKFLSSLNASMTLKQWFHFLLKFFPPLNRISNL